ncbi:class III lanthipeptide [Paenibacillus sp. SYP-B4298]|nr:class III lanthipeptide [Paenibacillus sp. SYP-B4298]
MNEVLELQKLAQDEEGKGQAVEATWTISTMPSVITLISTISNSNC